MKAFWLPSLIRRFENFYWEHRIGISSRGYYQPTWAGSEHNPFSTLSYRVVFRTLAYLSLRGTDVFVDLGCGKGRVTCCAARYRVAQVIGIEDVRELSQIAERNAAQMRGRRTAIQIINGKAEELDCTQATAFFLYNPFGPATLRSVLSNMQRSLRSNPRPIRIAYANPVYEAVLMEMGWLCCTARWQACSHLGFDHPVSFWKSSGYKK